MRATQSIYRAAGSPSMPGAVSGICRACGLAGQGEVFERWVKPTFTDHDKLQPGGIVCQACRFCFDDANAALGQRTGKGIPQRFRNYSHLVHRGEWIPLSKGDKRRMTELLLAEPEVAVIATSGQKHLAFRCAAGWWQIEEATCRPFPNELKADLARITELYQGGISKAEIETGRYNQKRILEFGLYRWQDLEPEIAPMRGSLRLQLAIFLAQKEEDDGTASADSE
jgi:hypothetical protein